MRGLCLQWWEPGLLRVATGHSQKQSRQGPLGVAAQERSLEAQHTASKHTATCPSTWPGTKTPGVPRFLLLGMGGTAHSGGPAIECHRWHHSTILGHVLHSPAISAELGRLRARALARGQESGPRSSPLTGWEEGQSAPGPGGAGNLEPSGPFSVGGSWAPDL